ncbi:MAG: glucosamine-6-phosphate deaminase [Planctomycetota bacterium]|jgi:glucosamine-6-phosphate deaminase|nr:hypothetical protein [Planctomycetota bacterium]MDP6518550.1 glucosamine-6-phosphate deaminase [Planctomycetota bacterium]MDP6838250.1 glucosamine-6-phosphate deaminase [Planctomycetota bacterium]MDP6954943.1 glucosamine-6-phosphate deaminase [Planctomycetota bacterium]
MSFDGLQQRTDFPAPVFIAPDAAAASQALALDVARTMGNGPLNLGLATGNTMRGVYAELVRMAQGTHPMQSGKLPVDAMGCFLLDEYLGLPVGSEHSFRAWLERALLRPLGLGLDRLRGPALEGDRERAAREYELLIADQGGIDLCLLGIGSNGHVAFNEPGSHPDSCARVVELHPTTRAAAAPAFGSLDAVPINALTLGLANLRACRELRLLALGEGKAEAVRRLLVNGVDAGLPASLLRDHPGLVVILDRGAAALLPE